MAVPVSTYIIRPEMSSQQAPSKEDRILSPSISQMLREQYDLLKNSKCDLLILKTKNLWLTEGACQITSQAVWCVHPGNTMG